MAETAQGRPPVSGGAADSLEGRDLRILQPWSRSTSRLERRELVLALLVLGALVAALFAQHLLRGGFWGDDYYYLAHFQGKGRSIGSIPDLFGAIPGWLHYRPGTTVLQVGYYLMVGESREGHLAFGIVFITLVCWLLFVVLRMLGLRLFVAGPAALLLAVFPFLDTARLNFSAYQQTIAGGLFLGGVALAIKGMRASEGRARAAWHAGAMSCYLLAAATHEAYLALLPGTILLYLLVGSRQEAVRRWLADMALFVVAYLVIGRGASATRGGDVTLGHIWTRLGEVADGTIEVFSNSQPADGLVWGPVGVAVVLVAVAGLAMAWKSGDATRRLTRQWLLVALGGLAFVVLGLAPLLPAPSDLTPAWQGFNSRVFVVASLGYAVFLVGLVFLVAIGWTTLVRRPAVALPVALAVLAAFAVSFALQELSNQDDWEDSRLKQEQILSAVEEGVGEELPPGDDPVAAVTFRHPYFGDGGTLVFLTAIWDLDAAVKLIYDDNRVIATPFLLGTRCEADHIGLPRFPRFPPAFRVDYGSVYFVDVMDDKTVRIDSRKECLRESRRLRTPVPA